MKRLMGLLLTVGLLLALSSPAGALRGQADKSAAPPTQATGTAPAATTSAAEAGSTDLPMSRAEADAEVEKLREAVRQSFSSGRGPRNLDPEAQKAIADAVDKFLSDPAIKGAIADKIQTGTAPWESRAAYMALMVPFAFFALVGLLFWLWFRSRHARIQAQSTAQMQLIEKFTSGTELAAFLSSPAGVQFMTGLGKPQANIRNRVSRHLSYGAVFGAVGLGCLLFSHAAHALLVFGVIFLFLGIGFLISAWLNSRLAQQNGNNIHGPAAGGSMPLPPQPQS